MLRSLGEQRRVDRQMSCCFGTCRGVRTTASVSLICVVIECGVISLSDRQRDLVVCVISGGTTRATLSGNRGWKMANPQRNVANAINQEDHRD
jgi:hypothetical protein